MFSFFDYYIEQIVQFLSIMTDTSHNLKKAFSYLCSCLYFGFDRRHYRWFHPPEI